MSVVIVRPPAPAAVETRTKGELAVEIASDFTTRDTVSMFASLRKGALDLSLYPISDAGQEFGDQLHLIGVVVVVTVELADAQIRRDADASLERGQRDLGLLEQSFLGSLGRNVGRDALQGL